MDRAVKKFPQLAPLVQMEAVPVGLGFTQKAIDGSDTDLPFQTLAEVADGLPRSLPFHSATVRFTGAAFGGGETLPLTGMIAADSWWVNGRQRRLVASFILNVAESAPKTRGVATAPAPDGPVAVFLAALGKPSKTNRFPLTSTSAQPGKPAQANSSLAEIVKKYRAKLGDLIAEAGMPHSLPTLQEALATPGNPHPLKPMLEHYFQPLGFSCKGGVGTFTLRRRTAANHVVEIDLDVGTWSRMVTAHFRVHVPGYCCTWPMPVAPALNSGGQYPIGDAERWEKIVANLAALAAHLDRQIVPEIDAAAGPAPEWFDAPN